MRYKIFVGGLTMSFRERLRRLRAEKDLTQAELAKVFGVAPTTIASWEQGRSRPDIEEIALIANYFGVSVDYLLCLTDEASAHIKGHKKRPQISPGPKI